jgi:hypothetical protein
MTDRVITPREPTLDDCEGALREYGYSKTDALAVRETLRHALGTPHEHWIARVLRTALAVHDGLMTVHQVKPKRAPRSRRAA